MPLQQQHCLLDKGRIDVPPGYESTTVPSTLFGKSTGKEGIAWLEANTDPTTGALRNDDKNAIRYVRNATSGTLTGGDCVTWASSYANKRIGAKVTQAPDATHIGKVDAVVCDHYTQAIPIGAMMRVVIRGQVKAKVATAAAVAVGDLLVATSTAGTVGPVDLSGVTAALAYNAISGSQIRAAATKDATGGAASTVATLCDVNLAPHVS